MFSMKNTFGVGLAGALALAVVSPSSAAPIPSAAALKQVVPSETTDIRWRGGGIAAGVGLGLLGGALITGAYGPLDYAHLDNAV